MIDKINKLLSLANSANEHEAKQALLKAQELMVEYSISEKDLQTDKEDVVITAKTTGVTFRSATWKVRLLHVIGPNFRCLHFLQRIERSTELYFFGEESDVDAAIAVYQFAVESIEKNILRIQREYQKKKMSSRGMSNMYAMGFVNGLNNAYEEQKSHNQEWGLVLAIDPKVNEEFNTQLDFTDSVVFKLDINKAFTGEFTRGYEDGLEFGTVKQLPQ